MIVTTAQLFKHAYGKYAVGAYNINNAEQAMGLFKGCIASKAPFIIQISKGARKYTDKRMLEAIIRAAAEIFPEAIFAVHLDHGDEETCYDCIKSGFFSSVMIDASHDPFEKNVEITKRVVVIEQEDEDVMAIHPVMHMALSYDHRVVDGVAANSFLFRVVEILEAGDFSI